MKRKGINLTLTEANEHQLKHGFPDLLPQRLMSDSEKKKFDKLLSGQGKQPNKTEAEFGRILESQKQRGHILRYVYEGMTFRWLDMRYTPDWIVLTNVMHLLKQMEVIKTGDFKTVEWSGFKAIEVKGPHIFDRDIVRFKGARALWPEITFEMWQKKAGSWSRIY